MQKQVHRKCPICGRFEGEVLFTQHYGVPDDSRLPTHCDLVCCVECGFVYSDTPLTQKDYDRFYEGMSKYEEPEIASGGGTTAWDRERLNSVAGELVHYLNYDSSVLDIGCANGGLLKIFKERGYYNLTGIDKSMSCINYLRNNLGIRAIHGGLFEHQFDDRLFSNEKFDLIILSHVLEHVYDLNSALQFVFGKLEPDGLLYLETPDASNYCDYPQVPFYYFDSEHINHFDLPHLRMLLNNREVSVLYSKQKEIPVSPTQLYPAAAMLVRNSVKNPDHYEIQSAKILKERITKYIDTSLSEQHFINIDKLAVSQEEVIVFGAGSYTQRLLGNSRLPQCNIIAFVDNDKAKQGLTLGGRKVLSPDYLKDTNYTVLICSALHTPEIVDQVRQIQIRGKIVSPTDSF